MSDMGNTKTTNEPSAAKKQKQEKKTQRKVCKAVGKELRFKQTLGALPDGVVLFVKDWVIDWINPIAARDLGLDAENDIGRRITDFYPDQRLVEGLRDGALERPISLTTKAGRILDARIISAGKKYKVLVTRDVTEHKRADDFRRDFVANVSHELRTPLTVLKGFLELSQDSQSTDQEKLHYKLMVEQVKRMGTLVDDLLTLSKLEQQSNPAGREIVKVMPMLLEAAEEGRILSQSRHTIIVQGDESRILFGDKREIKSAVTNLVSNAVRYTPTGGEIFVSCTYGSEGTVISVRDNGIGLAPEDIPRVTERFYRVDKSRSRDTGGTGLGLAIVKHILFRHQARLSIASEVGKGSDFKMIFPKDRSARI